MTLIELLVVLAIVGIVATLGAPPFLRTLARHAIAAQADELQDAMRLARSEAMKRGVPVVLCRTEAPGSARCAASGGNWQTWLLFADLGRSGAFATGDPILRQHLETSNRMSVTGDAASVRFEATGIARSDSGAPANFVLAPAGASADASGGDLASRREVCVNPRGEVAIVAGAAACP